MPSGALARPRLACAVFGYRLLKDSPEGAEADWRLEKSAKPGAPKPQAPEGGYRKPRPRLRLRAGTDCKCPYRNA